MAKVETGLALLLALVCGWVGMTAVAGAAPATDHGIAVSAAASGLKHLKPAQRKARLRQLRTCRQVRLKENRRRCAKRVRTKFRRIARRQANRALPNGRPVTPTAVHEVLVTDNTDDAIQSSFFLPIRDGVVDPVPQPYGTPSQLEIRRGEAVRFVWDPENRDSPHTIAPTVYPPKVNAWDFTFGASAAHGDVSFQRTFTVTGRYRFVCALHHQTQILELTVTR